MFFVILSYIMVFLVPTAFVAGVFVGWVPSTAIDLSDPRLLPFLHPYLARQIRQASDQILDEAEKKGLL